ncbi:MAG TPA: hypothetical protein VMM93_07350 [Vicinamibacterales bacterium]|nr:hypothetical protein [Vicinamibacterales bacterium]
MKRMLVVGTVLTVMAAWSPAIAGAEARQAPAQEKPQQPKAPATPAGTWDLSVQTDQGPIPSTLVLKVEEKKVTGTLASERGTAEIEGEFADGKLLFWLTMQGGNGAITINFSGSLRQDGSMSGTADAQGYQMSWTATRAKGL